MSNTHLQLRRLSTKEYCKIIDKFGHYTVKYLRKLEKHLIQDQRKGSDEDIN